jgi:hypothetical protein
MKNEIKAWLITEHEQVGIEGLRIDSVMSAIEHELAEIKRRELFDKRFSISKNISVLMYRSGTVEVHIGIKDVLSAYKEFTNA